MKVGFALPQVGKGVGPEAVATVALAAERAGYDSVWVLDRVLWPVQPRDRYPVTPDGRVPEDFQSVLDPIETLTYVAALTTRVQLGTSVLIATLQSPVLLARRLATLDVLSGGRVLCGVGIGWSHDEYEACGVPFAQRDARLAELVQAMIAVWTQETVEFKGRFYSIPVCKIGPKPVQQPHPPIYHAAFTPRALERAAAYGNGWNPVGPPSWDWLTEQTTTLKRMASDPQAFEVVLRAFIALRAQPRTPHGALFSGTLEQIKADVRRAAALGVSHIFFEVQLNPGANVQMMLERIKQLRDLA